jgi:hypothetical protein
MQRGAASRGLARRFSVRDRMRAGASTTNREVLKRVVNEGARRCINPRGATAVPFQ